jgi:hypothetical protein
MTVPRASQCPHESWVAMYQPCCTTTSESQRIKTQKGYAGKGCWTHPRVHSLSRGGPGGHGRYPEDRVPPRTSIKSRQQLPPPGWGQLQGCHVSPRLWLLPPGPGQLRGHHVPPRFQLPPSGTDPPCVTWAPAPTIWLMAAPESPRVMRTGSAGRKQINKYPLVTRPS